MTVNPLANLGRCAQCGLIGDAALFKPFNKAGNMACKATVACEIRQTGESAAYVLSRLLRAVRQEMAILTADELANLAVDVEGFQSAVHVNLSSFAGSGAALAAVRADRKARAAKKARTS